MTIDEDRPAGNPEWMLTYGDLMSLLLTIFVMLVSMAELKQTDKFQGVADSLHEQFGSDGSAATLLPGELRPRNSLLAATILIGRAHRQKAMNRHRHGLPFLVEMEGTQLTGESEAELRRLAERLTAKSQRIEIRAHVSSQTETPASGDFSPWESAYVQAHAVMRFLIAEGKVDPAKILISAAGPSDQPNLGPNIPAIPENPRALVILLEEGAD